MRRSVIIRYNVLTDDYGDIDARNELVDETIKKKYWFYDEDKTATDISYRVIKCKPNGDASINASFEYSK